MPEELPDKFKKNLKIIDGETVYVDCHRVMNSYTCYLCNLNDLSECLAAFGRKLLTSTMTQKEFLDYCVSDFSCVADGRTKEDAMNSAFQSFKKRQRIEVLGVLVPYFETGTEGIIWSVYEDGKSGYDGLNILQPLDHLTIYNPGGKVIFQDKIFPDCKAGWAEYPLNPGHGQPCALGCWIHWTQIGWQPDEWAKLFFRKTDEPVLRAKLVGMRIKYEPR